jgi:hypothetical protein
MDLTPVTAHDQRWWPLALGVIVTPRTPDPLSPVPTYGQPTHGPQITTPEWDTWTAWRLTIALAAYRTRYFLLHTIEIGPGAAGITTAHWARLWSLAMRTDADALFVLGLGPPEREILEPMTAELRLRLYPVDPCPSTTETPADQLGARGAAPQPQPSGPRRGATGRANRSPA